MLRYLVRRILISIPIVILATFLCFALVTAMGDPLGDWKTQKPRLPNEISTEEAIVGYNSRSSSGTATGR